MMAAAGQVRAQMAGEPFEFFRRALGGKLQAPRRYRAVHMLLAARLRQLADLLLEERQVERIAYPGAGELAGLGVARLPLGMADIKLAIGVAARLQGVAGLHVVALVKGFQLANLHIRLKRHRVPSQPEAALKRIDDPGTILCHR